MEQRRRNKEDEIEKWEQRKGNREDLIKKMDYRSREHRIERRVIEKKRKKRKKNREGSVIEMMDQRI